MAFSVFIHRPDSKYDDSPAMQYQFPKQYLRRVQESLGDWIVYLEPSKVRETRGYFAIARVENIIPDPRLSDMFLAVIEAGSFLQFSNDVPFNDQQGPIERGLLNDFGKLSGRAQSAVRQISALDFSRIVELGLDDGEVVLPRVGLPNPQTGFSEPQAAFVLSPRERVQQLTTRIVRDRVFRKIVIRAYDETCAFTGLRLINGGGRAEVDAAHIQPVEHNGPDVLNNGIALSGTAHWMFDRGLISLADNLEILVSRQVNDVETIRSFINKNGRATPPRRQEDHPHQRFLAWHREHCFKQ